MRIALDARTIFAANRRGTGKNLIDLYLYAAKARPSWEFVMIHRDRHEPNPFEGIANIRQKTGEIIGDRWNVWLHVRLPLLARAINADVLHCPANVSPYLPMIPMILTVHDIIPMHCPDRRYAKWWRKNVARGIKRARLVFTPSEFSRQQILNEFGDFADKIVVNHWAPDTGCRFIEDAAELTKIREKYALPAGRRFFLSFGARDGRKNTHRIIEAWKNLPAELRNEFSLLIVGLNKPAMQEFSVLLDDYRIRQSCILHGFAPEEDISALLSAADALCYVSLYEGFGLPILDAFTCRTPVLAGNATSLPEVAGDAAVFVDPQDTDAITHAMRRIMTDASLRESLVDRGLSQVKEFTWNRCVENYVTAVETLVMK